MMQPSMALGTIFFAIYLITILLALRVLRKSTPTTVVCGSAVIVYMFSLIFIGSRNWQINFFSYSSLYWFLTLSLLMLFGAIYKSISLRMMLHLLNKLGKKDSYDTILENYIKNQSYSNRIDILFQKQLIKNSGANSFNLTEKGVKFAKKIALVQRIFSIKESG